MLPLEYVKWSSSLDGAVQVKNKQKLSETAFFLFGRKCYFMPFTLNALAVNFKMSTFLLAATNALRSESMKPY